MRHIALLLIFCFSALVVNAQYKNKELAFNLNDGRSLYIAENEYGKVGVIDNNNNVIIPFNFFSAMKVLNEKNAFFIVYPRIGSAMEAYNLSGEKLIDSSKGYSNIYHLSPTPGYVVHSDKGVGMLDVNLFEIVPPVYSNISTALIGNYYLIGTQKNNGDVYTLTDKLLDSNWNSYIVPIEGSFIELNSLIPFAGINIPEGIPGKSPDVNSLKIIKLTNKPGTTPDKQFMPEGIYFSFNVNGSHPYPKLDNCYIQIPYKIEGLGDVLTITENGSNDALKFHGSKNNIIEFQIAGNSYKLKPQLFSESFKIDYLVKQAKAGNDRTIIESNYSKSWLDNLRKMLAK